MKKLISSILALTLSLCSFGTAACFADGSEAKSPANAPKIKAEQVIKERTESSATTEKLRELESQFKNLSQQINTESKTKIEAEKIKFIENINKSLGAAKRIAIFSGLGAVISGALYEIESNFSNLTQSLDPKTLSQLKQVILRISAYVNDKSKLGFLETCEDYIASKILSPLVASDGLLALNFSSLNNMYKEDFSKDFDLLIKRNIS